MMGTHKLSYKQQSNDGTFQNRVGPLSSHTGLDQSNENRIKDEIIETDINPNIDEDFEMEDEGSTVVKVENCDEELDDMFKLDIWRGGRDICRCCQTDTDVYWDISTAEDEHSYADMLLDCFGIELKLCAVLPRVICDACAARVRDACAFRRQVAACEARLLAAHVSPHPVKEEACEESDDRTWCDSDTADVAAPTTPPTEVPIAPPTQAPNAPTEAPKVPTEASKTPTTEAPKVLTEASKTPTTEAPKTPTTKAPKAPTEASKTPTTEAPKTPLTKAPKTPPTEAPKTPSTEAPKTPSTEAPKARILPKRRKTYKDDFKKISPTEYRCLRCDELVATPARKAHRQRYHPFGCVHCSDRFKTQKILLKHKIDKHQQNDLFKCNACDKSYFHRYGLRLHLKRYHMLGDKFTCEKCDYECYSRRRMFDHQLVHAPSRNFRCKYCKKTFMRSTNLRQHEMIHTGVKNKVCAQCGQAFVQKASLNYHMAKYHPNVKF